MWRKSLSTYIEGDTLYIEFNIGHSYMVVKGEVGAIGVQGSVTDGFNNVL